MKNHQINVQGMSCGHCAKSVESQLALIDGVQAKVSLETATVDINAPDSLALDKLLEAIQVAGYEAVAAS